jgi:hypothetical protein
VTDGTIDEVDGSDGGHRAMDVVATLRKLVGQAVVVHTGTGRLTGQLESVSTASVWLTDPNGADRFVAVTDITSWQAAT